MGFRPQNPGPHHDVREVGFSEDFGGTWAGLIPLDQAVPETFTTIHADEAAETTAPPVLVR